MTTAHRRELLSRWIDKLEGRLNLDPLIQEACGALLRLSGADRCSIMVLDSSTEELCVRWAQGVRVRPFGKVKFKLGEGMCGWVAQSQKPLYSFDVTKEKRFLPSAASRASRVKPVKAFGCLPLTSEGRAIGVVNLSTFKPKSRFNSYVKQRLTREFLNRLAKVISQAALLREAEAASERFRRILKSTSETVAQVSHEVRTPLTLITEGTQQLLDGIQGPLDSRQKESLESIKAQTGRMLRLVNELLDLSRMEAGRLSLCRKPLGMGELVGEVIRRYEPLIAPRKLTLQLDSVPPVYGDRSRLTQVAENLITNAVKFTSPEGALGISLRAKGRWAELKVSDTGVGMPKREQGRLFEKFFQGKMPAGSVVKGTGLGLTIVKEIVQLHGGAIRVWSRTGEGTTFTVSLPLYSPAFALTEEFGAMRQQSAREGTALCCQLFQAHAQAPISWGEAAALFSKHVSREDRVLDNPEGGLVILSVSDPLGFEAMRKRLERVLNAHPEMIPPSGIGWGWALVPQEAADLAGALRLARGRGQERSEALVKGLKEVKG